MPTRQARLDGRGKGSSRRFIHKLPERVDRSMADAANEAATIAEGWATVAQTEHAESANTFEAAKIASYATSADFIKAIKPLAAKLAQTAEASSIANSRAQSLRAKAQSL